MPLPLALVFHFNQHTTEYADIANRVCYRGLLRVLRAHPKLKFNLHLSGTLLRALPWFDDDSLPLVRAGLADGQFELLGSTYAQNVPYACDDWDNAQQIALHRQVLWELFGAKPTTFWISERCWRQSLAAVILEAGYTTTLVEDHILHAAGLVDPVPCATGWNEQALTLVYDDTILRDRFNYAAWFGRRAQLLKYLQQNAERPGSERFLLAYAEDAEAMGLWGWESGYLPQATWAGLDALLGDLEDASLYQCEHLSAAQPRQTLAALPDGGAQWMDRALANPDAPYHEDGYHDWFDFNQRAPKMATFRRLYGLLRPRLQALGSLRSDPGFPRPAVTPADRFYRQAIEAYCHHQYEFGCIGVGGRGYWGWENARASLMFARATELADDPVVGQWIEDVNGDGSDEQVLCDGRSLAVLTAFGGRLIYWFDLETGRQYVGNPLAVPPAVFEPGATKMPRGAEHPLRWLPESAEANLRPWQANKQKEAVPTRMGHRLPPWIFEREPAELSVYRSPGETGGLRRPLPSQVGALSESLQVDGGNSSAADLMHDFRFEPGSVHYLLFPSQAILVEKHLALSEVGVVARYVIANRDDAPHRVAVETAHELCPDYAAALGRGRDAYTYQLRDGRHPAVTNTATGSVLALEPSREWRAAECVAGLLAYQVRLSFELEVAAGAKAGLEIKLSHYDGEPGATAGEAPDPAARALA